MGYTEEEKEVLKTILENKEKILNIDIPNEVKRTLKIVIDIIEKQKNEIEELTYNNEILKKLPNSKEKYIAVLESKLFNSISKDKIKEKIKNLSEEEKKQLKGTKGQDRYSIKQEFMYKRSVLEKLLGDE